MTERYKQLVDQFRNLGYLNEHHFVGEYTYFQRPITFRGVRVYEDGYVLEQNILGAYEKVEV